MGIFIQESRMRETGNNIHCALGLLYKIANNSLFHFLQFRDNFVLTIKDIFPSDLIIN
jgi:hypothetical protein